MSTPRRRLRLNTLCQKQQDLHTGRQGWGVLLESGGFGPAASGRARPRAIRTDLSCRHYANQLGFPGCLLPMCILKFGFRPESFGFVLFTITAFSPRPLNYQLMSLGLVRVMEQRPGDNRMTHIFAERMNFL